jgi:hypothetical protein
MPVEAIPLSITVRVRREPVRTPEKCAGGAGSIEIGPTSIRYVPSTSNVPSARMVGRGNWPWPHPTARLHAVSATDKQAPSPVHRPVASGPAFGPAGLRLQPSRPAQATSATTNGRNARSLITPYNADRTTIKARQEQSNHEPADGRTDEAARVQRSNDGLDLQDSWACWTQRRQLRDCVPGWGARPDCRAAESRLLRSRHRNSRSH